VHFFCSFAVIDFVAYPNWESLAEAETPDDGHDQPLAQHPALLHLLPPLHLPPQHQPAFTGDSNKVVDGGGRGEDDKTLDSVADLDVVTVIRPSIRVRVSQDLECEGDSNKDICDGQGHHKKAISLASQLCLAEDDGNEEEVAEDGDGRVDSSHLDEDLL